MEANFTYGGKIDVSFVPERPELLLTMLQIPVGAIARFDFDQTAKSFARGWYVYIDLSCPIIKLTFIFRDKTELKQIPFVVNSLNGDLDINLNVTAKPSVAFKITLLSIASGKPPLS